MTLERRPQPSAETKQVPPLICRNKAASLINRDAILTELDTFRVTLDVNPPTRLLQAGRHHDNSAKKQTGRFNPYM